MQADDRHQDDDPDVARRRDQRHDCLREARYKPVNQNAPFISTPRFEQPWSSAAELRLPFGATRFAELGVCSQGGQPNDCPDGLFS